MPRYYYSGARDTVDGEKSISIYWLNKNGYMKNTCLRSGSLHWSRNGQPTGDIKFCLDTTEHTPSFRFVYRVKKHHEPEENYRSMDYKFSLVKIPCHFGGFRWFFQCGLSVKGVYCGRRVGILYSVGDYFGCRHCANLSYDSCNSSKRYRSGVFKVFMNSGKADDYYEKYVKRQFYKGRPTKKYQRYLNIQGNITDRDIMEIERGLLGGKMIK